MEEIHRMHKETQGGWTLFASELAAALKERRAEAATARANRRPSLPTLPGDLHHLAAPH
jgi:hypothetical protein